MIIDSEIKFEGIEYDAVSKYLGEYMSKEEKLEEKFEKIVHMKNENINKKKSKKVNGKPLNKNAGEGGSERVDDNIVNDDEATDTHKINEEELFLKPVRIPTNTEKRNMLAKNIEIMIIATLDNHIYKF